jgi:N-methylhydantoinase A
MSAGSPVLIGVDVGGTFTDCVLVDPARKLIRLAKVPSTTNDQSIGFVRGIDQLLGEGQSWDFDVLVHGTTVATNAVIERTGDPVALLTTAGFRDVLELRRRDRPHLYGLHGTYRPIVPRNLVFEVRERTDADGEVEEAPRPEDLELAIEAVSRAGVESVVVSFINSYANPGNERAAAEYIARRLPRTHVSCASEISREHREFERTSTASVDAYVQRVMKHYLVALRERAEARGFRHDIWVSQSNGGRMSLSVACDFPVKTLLSGPAAGAIAGQRIAEQAGYRNAVTMDMGGTSLDVGVLIDGRVAMLPERQLEFGIPIRLPMVDVETIGAGGGSIAQVDLEGLLAVGPESAGAMPGPACYAKGGTKPTITDADLVLGRLGEGRALGSDTGLVLHRALAERAIAQQLSAIDGEVEDLAAAIIEVAVRKMAASFRLVTSERGLDPGGFALVCFGGAGPLHVCDILREVPFCEAIVPLSPGITSALGCLIGDAKHDFVQTIDRSLNALPADAIAAVIRGHAEQGWGLLKRDNIDPGGCTVIAEAEMRYEGQTHTITVPLGPQDVAAAGVQSRFEEIYARRFGRIFAQRVPIVASIRTTIIGTAPALTLQTLGAADRKRKRGRQRAAQPLQVRTLRSQGVAFECPVYSRDSLAIGQTLTGPAIVEQPDTTCLIDVGFRGRVDEHLNIRIQAV